MSQLRIFQCETLRRPARFARLIGSLVRWPANGVSLRFKAICRLVRVRAGGRGYGG
jgi:hypothetical protein